MSRAVDRYCDDLNDEYDKTCGVQVDFELHDVSYGSSF